MGWLDPSEGLGETSLAPNTIAIPTTRLGCSRRTSNGDLVQVHVGRAALPTPTDADILLPLAELAPRQEFCSFLATYHELLPLVLPNYAVAFLTPPLQRASSTLCAALAPPPRGGCLPLSPRPARALLAADVPWQLPPAQTVPGSFAAHQAPSPSTPVPFCAPSSIDSSIPFIPLPFFCNSFFHK